MLRRLAVVAAGVLALSAVGVTGAGAATPPAVGSLSCDAAGTINLKPALNANPSTKAIAVSQKKGPVTPCDASNVSGGKAPINGGLLDMSTKLPKGSNCLALASGLPSLKVTLKLTNTSINPKTNKPKVVTVVTVKPINVASTVEIGANVILHVTGDVAQNRKGNAPFGGDAFTLDIDLGPVESLGACIVTGVTTLSYSGASLALTQPV